MKKPRLELYYPYPKGEVAAQRFRIEHYLPYLQNHFDIKIRPFWSQNAWEILYTKGHFINKFLGLLNGFAKRFFWLIPAVSADYIYILREATPIGPPIIEWILAKILRKKIIYDFDDAIWLPNQSEVNRGVVKHLKYHTKVAQLCTWAYKVCVGNEFLAEYAGKFNNNVVIIPTTIDTENLHNPELLLKKKNTIPIIGWTGTHSTIQQLDILWPVLDRLILETPFVFHVISDGFPKVSRKYIRHILWNKASEIEDLMQFDVGVMPLFNNEWEKGKCGFKLLQYMSLEIPSIASDVGVNNKIINHPDIGIIIIQNNTEVWERALLTLINNDNLKSKMGLEARKRVIEVYSVQANKNKVVELFT
jgi:glycosyltransferase involved in cell wall biosynthesis